MDKRFLEDCLAKGMSLETIGKQIGRHPSTVGYWLKKHRLSANGAEKFAARGAVSRDELKAFAEAGASIAEIAVQLDRSVSTIQYWLRRYGIKTLSKRESRLRRATARRPRSSTARAMVGGSSSSRDAVTTGARDAARRRWQNAVARSSKGSSPRPAAPVSSAATPDGWALFSSTTWNLARRSSIWHSAGIHARWPRAARRCGNVRCSVRTATPRWRAGSLLCPWIQVVAR
jgi:transposase